jgi:hypothetical protein
VGRVLPITTVKALTGKGTGLKDTKTRITEALAREEAHAELIANRIRLLLLAIFTVIAIANVAVVETETTVINFGALAIGYSYGLTVYFWMRSKGYRPLMKYLTTFLDVLLIHLVLFLYTLKDQPSWALKGYVFMVVFPVIMLTIFRYDPKFTLLSGSFAILLYLVLFIVFLLSRSITFGRGYYTELFTPDVTIIGQLTKVLILCGFVVIAAYMARYTRRLFVKLVSSETTIRLEVETMERELELASQVQAQLLPKTYPTIEGLQMYGTVLPGRFVGGDYYDFLKISDQSLVLVIADVSGHGVPAALIMAEVRASVHILTSSENGLVEMAKRLNSLLLQSTARKDYVTFFVGEINTRKGILRYINAGHPPPILFSDGRPRSLPDRTVGLGLVLRLPRLRIREAPFKPDSMLVSYTDGITERTNMDGEQYGEQRLHAFIKRNADLDAQTFTQKLLDEVRIFGARQDLEDDVTLAVVKRV